MKLNILNAAAIIFALTASSVQAAAVIYDVDTPTNPSNTVSYGSQTVGSLGTQIVDGWGDYIGFPNIYPRYLTEATFWLSSNLTADPSLTLYIDGGAFSGSWLGSWDSSGNLFEYSFLFSTPLPVVLNEFEYLLVLDDPTPVSGTNNNYLNIAVSTTTVGTDIVDSPAINAGEVLVGYTPSKLAVAPLSLGGTIAVRFSAVPEPATLTLFGLGLIGLGYVHRRKIVS